MGDGGIFGGGDVGSFAAPDYSSYSDSFYSAQPSFDMSSLTVPIMPDMSAQTANVLPEGLSAPQPVDNVTPTDFAQASQPQAEAQQNAAVGAAADQANAGQAAAASSSQNNNPLGGSKAIGGLGQLGRMLAMGQTVKSANQYAGMITAYGQYQAQAMQNQGLAQAQAYQMNATMSQNNAAASLQAAQANVAQQKRSDLMNMGSLQAQVLANGVTMSGTPLLLMGNQASQNSLAENTILQQGQVQATNYNNQASQQNYAAQMAQYNANINAQGALYASQMQAYQIQAQAAQSFQAQLMKNVGSYGANGGSLIGS